MMPSLKPDSRLLAAAVLALAFIAGAAAGVIMDRTLIPRSAMKTRITADMTGILDRLALTQEQRAEAEAIFQRSSPRMEVVMRDVANRLQAISDSVDLELRKILTAEQRIRLDSLRRQPTFLLKRKTSREPATVDTLLPAGQSQQ
jgi:Spy/CpxP family protein refolding chaperone